MLLGRDAERARLAELLAEAHAGASAALVIRGEPGIGKSALLDDAIAAADGMTVLRARGVESESELSFAGLADLLGPVTAELGSLPPPQRAALAGALALGPPVPGDRFTLYAATLSLLAAVGERAPVLVAVDDAPWLDAPSREALVFVARRLQEEGVVLLLAARSGEPVGGDLPELVLGGLDAVAAAALLGGDIAPEVAARLFDATGGNPLALLELSGAAERRAAQRRRADRGAGAGRRRHRAGVQPPARSVARADPAGAGGRGGERVRRGRRARRRRARPERARARRGGRPDRDRRGPGHVPPLRSCAQSPTAPCRRPSSARRTARSPPRSTASAAPGTSRRRPSPPTRRSRRRSPRPRARPAPRGGPAAAMRAAERAARLTPDPAARAGRLLEAADDVRARRPPRARAGAAGRGARAGRDPRCAPTCSTCAR